MIFILVTMSMVDTILTQKITGTLPVMEYLDKDHVQVHYSQAFHIPDFSEVTAVSVYVGKKVCGVANREDFSKVG